MKACIGMRWLIASAVFLAGSSPSFAQSPTTEPYVTDTRGTVVRNATYLCWHTGYWTPAAAIAECDPDLVPKTRPAPPSPAAAAPPVAPAVAQAAPPPPPSKPVAPVPMVQKVTLSAETLFDFDKSALKPEGRRKLDELVNSLTGVNIDVVIAVGHTDSIGGDAYNQRLSLRRAQAVKNHLVGKGIAASRVTAEGRGEKHPVASNKTRDGRAKNRRVEVEVVGTGSR